MKYIVAFEFEAESQRDAEKTAAALHDMINDDVLNNDERFNIAFVEGWEPAK